MTPLDLYHGLPAWARAAAAGAYGLCLDRRRYSRDTERLVAEALDRERWPAARLRRWQEQRLAEQLDRAARRVPYYREAWAARRRRGDRRSWDRLEHWPLLDKATVRRHGAGAFLADDHPRRLYPDHTSGSTGSPLRLWRSRRTLVARYALYEARHRNWYGVSRRDPWAMVGGRLVVAQRQTKPPYWVWNAAQRQLYVSSYHLEPAQARASLDEMARREIRLLWGYPSSLDALARAVLSGAARVPRPAVAVANAEPLLASQRERIERAFGCPVRETYGMVELVAAAGECHSGTLHLFPEMGWTETLDPDGAPSDGLGELVATSLLDRDLPLVRYRTGDLATRGPSGCACGRSLPALAALEGRVDDTLVSADGRPVGRLDPVFKQDIPIREAQLVQRASGDVLVRFVPERGFTRGDRRRLESALHARLGDLPIRFETLEAIPRGPNGKFRAVIRQSDPQPSLVRSAPAHADLDPRPVPQ